jgi:hypothetical protein
MINFYEKQELSALEHEALMFESLARARRICFDGRQWLMSEWKFSRRSGKFQPEFSYFYPSLDALSADNFGAMRGSPEPDHENIWTVVYRAQVDYLSCKQRTCPSSLQPAIVPRPGNCWNVEITQPQCRCLKKAPDHWAALNAPSAARWLGSGGSPSVFGICTPGACPKSEHNA